MNITLSKKWIKLTLFNVFLVTFAVSFFSPSLYQPIVYLQFSILLPVIIFLYFQYKSLSQIIQVLLIGYTAALALLGVPGSALGYVLSASIGLFVSGRSANDDLASISNQSRLLNFVALVYISACLFLFYSNIQSPFGNTQMGEYFGIASINYASLTVASFGLIFATWCVIHQFHLNHNEQVISRIVAALLFIAVASMAIIFTTRSIILSAIPLLLYAIQPNGRQALFLACIFIISIAVNFEYIYNAMIEFVVPGRASLFDLYESELLFDGERILAIINAFIEIAPKIGLCVNCSEYMSFSGMINLITLSFPFSLIYVFYILKYVFLNIFAYHGSNKPPFFVLLILGSCFFSAIIQTLLQADFLSVISLFYIVGAGIAYYTRNSTRIPLQTGI